MSVRSVLGDMIKGPPPNPAEAAATDPRNQIKQGIFSNVKIIVLVAFVAILAWNATNKLLTPENMKDIADVIKLLIIVEGVVHLAIVIGNMRVKCVEVRAFMADGTLTAAEAEVLRTQQTIGSKTTPAASAIIAKLTGVEPAAAATAPTPVTTP